jgi:N-acyl amino acid synthase of PEP-CTERM/exosortase system
MSHTSLGKHFLNYFVPVVANTSELLDECYRIRYDVYCKDLGYEPMENFPDGREIDSYDPHSIHYLLRHIPSGLYAGCVRVIYASTQLEKKFPFEKVCSPKIDLIDEKRQNFCEISRLAVRSNFRRRLGESSTPQGIIFAENSSETVAHERREHRVIAFSLYWISIIAAAHLNLDILALMEPRLVRHLKQCQIFSEQIGDLVEYHGSRAPYLIKANDLIERLYSQQEELDDLREFVEILKTMIVPSPISETSAMVNKLTTANHFVPIF